LPAAGMPWVLKRHFLPADPEYMLRYLRDLDAFKAIQQSSHAFDLFHYFRDSNIWKPVGMVG
jgi:hypothetical protein